ncbi:MAG: discoidin domain-containing protein [Candidatus Brocadiia bacterium]
MKPLSALALGLTVLCSCGGASAADFASAWPPGIERIWPGPATWSNRLQDWRIADGRLECTVSGGDRNVHLLTHQLGQRPAPFQVSVRLGRLGEKRPSGGWAGFRVGIRGQWDDYRDSVRRGKGLDAGLTTEGQLFIGSAGAARLEPRGIPRKDWTVHFVSSQEMDGPKCPAENAFDGRPGSIWHSQWVKAKGSYPYELQIDLGQSHQVCGLCVLPRQEQRIGRIASWEVYVSRDGEAWGEPVAKGTWPDTAKLQTVHFEAKAGRYVRLRAMEGIVADRPACAVAELYVLDTKTAGKEPPPPEPGLALDDLVLRLTAQPGKDRCRLALAALDPESGEQQAEVSRAVPADSLAGNVALVCHARVGGRGGQRTGGNVRFWFRDWRLAGPRVEAHPDHAFGPILWCQHTLSRGVLTLTAQMPPLGEKDAPTVRLQVRTDGQWRTVGEEPIHPMARTATFRVRDWDASRDVPYRAAYALIGPDGQARDHYWEGTIRKDPVAKDPIVVAAFTGNADYAFPNLQLVEHVAAHDPDLLFFSGDNIYENVGGYGCQRAPLEMATLGYLRKWYFFGWAYADLLRDRPTISIPDDHDVYQGNLWGHGGRKAPHGPNSGGYTMPPEWVNMVQRTQTSNLPEPYDPTPVEQGITVYYTALVYGRVGFAVIEDRKWKTGPEGLVPPTRGRSDHVSDPDFDPRTADVPEARLLGERQLRFLRRWAADWRGTDMKCALSQTTFANVATHHGGGLRRLVADYDSNGWPQTGRNKAVDALRRGFALHIGGDQHLATVVHHGIEGWGDATWSFTAPSIANFYPRAWMPEEPAHDWKPGMMEHTGQFRDPFDNFITVHAHTNPRDMGKEPAWLHDKMPGYAIVRFHKADRTLTMECWPLFADPREPETGGQYQGWPIAIAQRQCYGREPAAWLPAIVVEGMSEPVVQVVDEASDEVLYTLRIRGRRFRPWVFREGTYTVRVGAQEPSRMKVLRGIRSVDRGSKATLEVSF